MRTRPRWVIDDPAPASIAGIWYTDDGRLVTAGPITISDEAQTVLESYDHGHSWSIGSCPAENRGREGRCGPVIEAGPLEVRPGEVSVDDGDWQQPAVQPPPERGDTEHFQPDDVTELPTGGWLATADLHVDQENSFGVLTRSDDGVTWNQVLPDDPCAAEDLDPAFSRPTRLDTGWLVVHSCFIPTGGSTGREMEWADLYVLDGAATEPVGLPDARIPGAHERYGQPVAVGEAALIPVAPTEGPDRGVTEVVVLTP